MLSTLITLIVVLIVLGLLFYALNMALALLPIDSRIRTVITILVIVILAVAIANYFGLTHL